MLKNGGKKKRKHLNKGDNEQNNKKKGKDDKMPKYFDKFRNTQEGLDT